MATINRWIVRYRENFYLGSLLRLRRHVKGRASLAVLLVIFFSTVFAPLISTYDPNFVDGQARLKTPSTQFLFGSDHYGRDVFSRVVWGGRISLYVGFAAVLINVAIGVAIGLVAGYKGGRIDDALMRVVDMLMAFPSLILALAAIATLGPSITNLVLVIGIVYIPSMSRVTRSVVIVERGKLYVESARSIGKSNARIALTEVLPNCLAPITVQATLNFSSAILIEASLSFLGLGVQPPDIAWGSMLFEARGYMTLAPWAAIIPGMAIFVTVMAINMLGDALRDVMDPMLRR